MVAMMLGGLVGDRQPAGHRRRARRVGQRSEPGHARRRGHGHARRIPTARWPKAWRASSAARSADRGATWSSATCAGARTRAAWTRGCARRRHRDRGEGPGRDRPVQSAELLRAARARTANCSSRCPPTASSATRSTIRPFRNEVGCSTCCAAARKNPATGRPPARPSSAPSTGRRRG